MCVRNVTSAIVANLTSIFWGHQNARQPYEQARASPVVHDIHIHHHARVIGCVGRLVQAAHTEMLVLNECPALLLEHLVDALRYFSACCLFLIICMHIRRT